MDADVTVVLPTYNEADNVRVLLPALREAFAGVAVELLVVDDASPDGTAEIARQTDPNARVIVRTDERGLATAVVHGLKEASGRFVIVMDTDLQHPVEAARAMYDAAVQEGADLVVGSRYARGGDDGAFSWARRTISKGAASLSRLALPPVRQHDLSDPMSGLFLARRDAVAVERLRPTGYKILLEILARCRFQKVVEVPYSFQSRTAGESKLGAAVIMQYLLHLLALGVRHPDNQRPARFALVGLTGVVVNIGILVALRELAGFHHLMAAALSVEASIVWNFFLNDRFTFRDRRAEPALVRLARFNTVSLGALMVNLLTLFLFADILRFHYVTAELIAIGASFGVNYLGNLNWTYGGVDRFRLRASMRRMKPLAPVFIVGVAAFGLFAYDLDRADEIYFDEHYYISVAYQIHAGIWEDPCWQPISEQHRPVNFEHPPLAKLIIAWSVSSFDPDHQVFRGCRDPNGSGAADYNQFTGHLRDHGDPVAWRMPSVVFGTMTVLFTGLAAARLTRSPNVGALAGAFVAMDGVVLTSSRVAVLDIFAAGFAMIAFWAATFPGKRGVLGSAIAIAFAFTSKFTALFVGFPLLALLLWTNWRAGRLNRRLFDGIVASFVLIPNAALLVSYAPWWRIWIPELGLWGAVKHWFSILGDAIGWGTSVPLGHAYGIRPYAWFSDARPTFYYAMWNVAGVPGLNRYIYAVGNPILWWSAAAAALVAFFAMVGRAFNRGPGSPWRALWRSTPQDQTLFITAVLPIMCYAGFLGLTREAFLFYMTIVVPLLALSLAVALWWLWERGSAAGRTACAVIVLAVVAAFLHYYPITVAADVHETRFRTIMDAVPWMRA